MGAVEHFHARLALVGHQVQVLGRAGQVGSQVDDAGVEADEHESAIDLGTRGGGEVGPLELLWVAVFTGHRDQSAAGAEAPAMVKAG